MTAPPTQELLKRAQKAEHPRCSVCGPLPDRGLGLSFSVLEDGRVEARFACDARYEGYTGLLHGGITSAVLDGAMTNCLFAHGIIALTAELTVRFKHPVRLNEPLTVSASLVRSAAPLHIIEARIEQGGKMKAKATGKFMEKSTLRHISGKR
jgi:uncharacterized protein (TIGR00369 family)